MKKLLRISYTFLFLYSISSNAQQQIGNGNMEAWDNVGASTEEPSNWNSFKSAQGGFTGFASQQIQRSTAVRPGATGAYCARVWAKSTLGIVANGNMTLGRINMGSTTPSDPANYNTSLITDANFSEAITSSPDSIVFWVKFTAASGNSLARVHAVLHDNYALRDPIDANSAPHVVATAALNYPPTGGVWVRKSVPFTYSGPSSNPQFLLVTFTTNQTPGGGANNDEILVDDIELIYNPVNQPIVANDDVITTSQDIAVTIAVLSNDTDPENAINSASVTIVSNPSNGSVSVNATTGEVTYTPAAGFFGTDAFTYSVCDAGSPVSCDQAVVTVTVNQVIVGNNQIIANNDNAVTDMNVPVVIDVLANDVDPENQVNANSVTVVNNPSNGTVTVNSTTGEITYTPQTGYFGNDSFTYSVCDEFTGAAITCDTATVNVVVNIPWGIEELNAHPLNVSFSEGKLFFSNAFEQPNGEFFVYSLSGELIQWGEVTTSILFTAPKGMYLVNWKTENYSTASRIVVY